MNKEILYILKNKKIKGIYKLTSPSGKIYIGQSKNIYKRYLCYSNIGCKNQPRLLHSLLKHGFNNHKFELIIECESEELNDLETFYIKKLKSSSRSFGLNCNNGGGAPKEISLETRKKQSEAKKTPSAILIALKNLKKAQSMTSPNKGKKLSDVTKQRMREAREKNKHKKRNRIYVCSQETKDKISKTLTGNKMSKETIDKRSLSNNKILLNLDTGIFYYGFKEASISLNLNERTFINRIKRVSILNTNFVVT